MKSFNDENASVSYYHTPSAVREFHDTDSILTLITKLTFSVEEAKKEQFFNELEFILINESKKEPEPDYSDLISFFLRHITNGMTIAY